MVREAIADYLESKGIKQIYLAQKSGMTPQAICTYLKGERSLEIEEYIKLCDALEVPYDFFIEAKHPA